MSDLDAGPTEHGPGIGVPGGVPRPRPGPGPLRHGPGQGSQGPTAGGAEPIALRSEIMALLDRIDTRSGPSTDLFESAHEVLLRALGTVDRA